MVNYEPIMQNSETKTAGFNNFQDYDQDGLDTSQRGLVLQNILTSLFSF